MSNHPPCQTDPSAIAAELRLVVGKLKRKLQAQLQLGDLNWSQVSAIGCLEREGAATVTALARAEGVRPQSMGSTVAALHEAGLVTSAPDPKDGRQTIWSLTPLCHEKISLARAAKQDWLVRSIVVNLSLAEQEKLGQAVELLKRLV